ncbi:MAG: hypothetical protein GY861_09140 [bacterium]|nr:hypothetical protein [bacterium]
MRFFSIVLTLILLASFVCAQEAVPTLYEEGNLDTECKKQYECQQSGDDYWYDCFEDNGECRCLLGEFSKCDFENSSINLDEWCAYKFECTPRGDDFYKECFYDTEMEGEHEDKCRCYVGNFEDCRLDLSSVIIEEEPEKEESKEIIEPEPEEEEESEPGIFGSAINRLKNFWQWLLGYPEFFKTGSWVLAVIIIIIIALLYYFYRDSPSNNVRRARRYHRLAEKAHSSGKEEKSKRYYAMAEDFRTRTK